MSGGIFAPTSLLATGVGLVLLLLASTIPAEPRQLYAISNKQAGPAQWPGYEEPTIFYRVQDDALTEVRTINEGPDLKTTFFVRPYQDIGLVLVGLAGKNPQSIRLEVIDLSRMSQQKSHRIDHSCKDCRILDGHLLKMDERLIYMAEEGDYERPFWPPAYEGDSGGKVWFHGIDLGTGDFVRGLAGDDLVYVRSFGYADGWSDRVLGQSINNDYISVTVPLPWEVDHQGRETVTPVRVTRKSDGALKELAWQGYPIRPRGFHQWVVAEEAYAEEGRIHRFFFYHRAKALPRKTPLAHILGQTGRMFFYNAESGRQVIHDTGEPDCEVLLIDEDDAVYYRVSDELRRANIAEGGLINIEWLVKAPEMLDVHWLVMGTW